MAETIENGGTGVKIGAHVDQNEQLHVHSISRSNTQDSTIKGKSYNINTGDIGLTSATESAVLYFNNTETAVDGSSDFVIDAVAIGIDSLGTTAGMAKITIVRNPTTGTIIDNAVAADMVENRNFGSSNSLSSNIYKGVEGDTFTNGADIAIFYQTVGTRGYYTLDMELQKGSSVGVKIDTQTSAGTTNVYAAIIGHRIDGKNA
jgi:hypothetical protein